MQILTSIKKRAPHAITKKFFKKKKTKDSTSKRSDTNNLVTQRGYRCAYLPTYSPKLNPKNKFSQC